MKKILALVALSLLWSCQKSDDEAVRPTYNLSTISLSSSELLIKTKEVGYAGETLVMSVESDEEIPLSAYYISSLDPEVATAQFDESGNVVITPVGSGETKIFVSLQDKSASCEVEVREFYFDKDFAAELADPWFGFVLDDDGDIDINDSVNQEKIANLTTLSFASRSLTSLAGVEYLTELESLNCSFNYLTKLDVSACTKLTTLKCYSNSLAKLDVSGCGELGILYCYKNALTELDLSGCGELLELSCNNNYLTELDLSVCTKLEILHCYTNYLTQLDVTMCDDVDELICGSQYKGMTLLLTLTRAQGLGVWASSVADVSYSGCNDEVSLYVVD